MSRMCTSGLPAAHFLDICAVGSTQSRYRSAPRGLPRLGWTTRPGRCRTSADGRPSAPRAPYFVHSFRRGRLASTDAVHRQQVVAGLTPASNRAVLSESVRDSQTAFVRYSPRSQYSPSSVVRCLSAAAGPDRLDGRVELAEHQVQNAPRSSVVRTPATTGVNSARTSPQSAPWNLSS